MNISWHGLSAFSFTNKGPEGEVKLVVDPYDNSTGLRFPRTLTADIIASSHNALEANNTDAVGRAGDVDPFIVDLPGEFEVKGIFVYAINAPRAGDKIPHRIFRINIEGVKIAHLGALNRDLTDDEVKQLGNIDILILPVGGTRVLDPKMANKIIGKIEPRVVIPTSFDLPNVKENLGTVDAFCKELGVCQREDVSKLKISRKTLPEEDIVIYVLSRD